MTKEAIDPNKNRFLALIEKMAEDRKQTVEEFADLFHYTPDGVQFLRDNFWFNPSEALLRILADEVELTVEEDQDLSELEFDSMDQTPADALFEMIQIFELLLSGSSQTGHLPGSGSSSPEPGGHMLFRANG